MFLWHGFWPEMSVKSISNLGTIRTVALYIVRKYPAFQSRSLVSRNALMGSKCDPLHGKCLHFVFSVSFNFFCRTIQLRPLPLLFANDMRVSRV